MGLFKFAQTVENDAWEVEKIASDIRNEIFRVSRQPSSSTLRPTYSAPPKHRDDTRRYTILNHSEPDVEGARPTIPPKIAPSENLSSVKSAPGFKLYDAVLATDRDAPTSLDTEMDKFLPMLNDYLKIHDLKLGTSDPSGPETGSVSNPSKLDDYVWDVFYHKPTTIGEWNEVANIGTLTGLPPSITDPNDSTSESEEEDEADEDSNAEEYYKNDYPEDGSSSEDEFHEDSEYDEILAHDEGDALEFD